MSEIFSRNEMIWGEENQEKLSQVHVAILGLGGVGGYTAESLARAGIGELTILDFDEVSKSNINRQIVALYSTVDKKKTELFEQRLKDINPEIKLNILETFYTEELNQTLFSKEVDYVVDAIDTLKSKIQLLEYCHTNKIPVITSLGAANRIDPTKLEIHDLSKIKDSKCPFTKNVLRILNKKGVLNGITAVISKEPPYSTNKIKAEEKVMTNKEIQFTKVSPGSTPFVPPVAGYFMAFYIVKKILELK